MLQTLKAKIIASILALVVIGGGITAAVVISSNSEDEKPEKKVESTQEDKEDNSGKEEEENSGGGSFGDNSGSGDSDSNNLDYYVPIATEIVNTLEEYVDALKSGDMEILLKYTNPESDDGKFLQAISEYPWASDFIVATYVNFEWYYKDDEVYFLANSLSRNEGEDTELFYCHIAAPTSWLLDQIYVCQHSEGVVVPEEIEFENSDEALEIFSKVMVDVPCHYTSGADVTVPDENGDFYVDFGIFSLMDFDAEDVEDDEEDWLTEYVDYYCTGLGVDMYVGESDGEFEEYHEELMVMDSYMQNKDFAGWNEWFKQNMGLDYETTYGAKYGKYEDLNETQKAWVDDFIENEMTYTYYEYYRNTSASDVELAAGCFVITYPDLSNGQETVEWAIENDSMVIEIIYPNLIDLETGAWDFDGFMYSYYDVIKYALENIE